MKYNWGIFLVAIAFLAIVSVSAAEEESFAGASSNTITAVASTASTAMSDLTVTALDYANITASSTDISSTIPTTDDLTTLTAMAAVIDNLRLTTDDVPTEMPYPITRLGPVVYIDCDYTLQCLNPATGEWEPAEYLVPEFDVVPENVLWVVEPQRSYRMQVDFGNRTHNLQSYPLPSNIDYQFDVIYTGLLPEGSLGTFQIEFSECVDGVFIVYRGVLKFVADDGAELFCAPNPTMDAKGVFTIDFCPRTEASRYFEVVDTDMLNYTRYQADTPFQDAVPVSILLDWSRATVHNTDLGHYLYPHGVPQEMQWYFDQPLQDDYEFEAVG